MNELFLLENVGIGQMSGWIVVFGRKWTVDPSEII